MERLMEQWSREAKTMAEYHRQEFEETGAAWEALLLESLNDAPGKRALDAGCGTGFISLLLARNGWHVTAVDLSEAMIEQGRCMAEAHGLSDRISFHAGNVEDIALAPGSFDAVVSRHASWLFRAPERTYGRWVDLLRPGGVLLNMDANWLLPYWGNEEAAEFWKDDAELARRYGSFHDYYHDAGMMKAMQEFPLAFQQRPSWDEALCRSLGLVEVQSRVLPGNIFWNAFLALRYRTVPTFALRAQKPYNAQ